MTKRRIMIVDDEKITLRMTDHILSSEYETVCAGSGREAIELYREMQPDLVLSDIRMPEMDGLTLQKLLQEEYGRLIPFMFMTADSEVEMESRGFEVGALDFIRKPFRADVLLRRVANILSSMEKIDGLKKAAMTDSMTGLLNKTSSQEEINALCRNTGGALMMIDLDSFKPVNDVYGHDMGDKVLIRFAEILCSVIRSTDIAGRMGGDEFVLFCQNISDESVIAEKSKYINEQIVLSAKQLMGEDMNIPIGASIGCALAPLDGQDFQTLFKKADMALYDVKQGGKHGYKVFKDERRSETDGETKNSALSTAMLLMSERSPGKGALVLNNDQFKIVYHFLSRIVANYRAVIHVMLYSVTMNDKDSPDSEAAVDEFADIMRASLRQSDVLTRLGRNQVMLILQHASSGDIDVINERVMTNWKGSSFCDKCTLSYESDVIA